MMYSQAMIDYFDKILYLTRGRFFLFWLVHDLRGAYACGMNQALTAH